MNKKGFSLIEILISTSVAVLIGGLLIVIMVNITRVFFKESSGVSIGLNTNDALAEVRKSIKQSSGVEATYTAGSTTYTSGATQIVLKVPSLDQSGNIIGSTFDYFVFFQTQNILHFKTFPNAASKRKAQDQIFSNLVDSLVFKYLSSANPPVEVTPTSASKVRITLILKQKTGQTYETNSATSEANLRNN